MHLTKTYAFACACFCAVLLMSILYFKRSEDFPLFKTMKNFENPAHKRNSNVPQDKYLILVWQKLWGYFKGFNFSHCPVSNCIITQDKDLFRTSDAVIFSGRFHLKSFPHPKPPNQYWIFQIKESQIRGMKKSQLKNYNGKMNLMMTFLTDSDIPNPYGGFRRDANTRKITDDEGSRRANRTKLVAWLVSHCSTHSKREVYFKQLRKHINADQFGKKCSPTAKCPKINCLEYISKNYKFYFAAENSLCKDYITEKVYRNAYYYGMVPIVYGGANYSKFLPPKSYIDVQDFDSPKKLADFLKVLHRNDTLYNEYFKWMQEFELYQDSGFCNLCEYMNKPSRSKVYTNITEVWNTKDCISSGVYLEGIL